MRANEDAASRFFFFIAKIVEIYKNREKRHEYIQNNHKNKDRKTNILDFRIKFWHYLYREVQK